MRYVMFWLVGEKNQITGVRGYCDVNQDRYELSPKDEQWEGVVVVPKTGWPDDWGFQQIASGSLFECMIAVENHAKSCAEDEIPNTPKHWDTED